MSKKGLGKGLAALIPENMDLEAAIEPKHNGKKAERELGKPLLLPLSHISPNPDQPRKDFDEAALLELAESIKSYGVLQPIVVTEAGKGVYLIIAGERRFRAAKLAGLTEIPAFVRSTQKEEILELALIENIQRENLNSLEEAISFRALMDEFGYTQEQLAEKMGKSRPYVANALRLLTLAPGFQKLVREGALSSGHGRAVLSLAGKDQQQQLVDAIIKDGLSVRQAEQLAKDIKEGKTEKKQGKKQPAKNKRQQPKAAYEQVLKRLEEKYGTKITVAEKEKGGQICIQYFNEGDLTRLIELLLPGEIF